MIQIDGSQNFPSGAPSPVVAIGNFDGVHVAHRLLINLAIDRARELGGTSVVYTFDPHPVKILAPDESPLLIQTLEQRIAEIARLGVSACVVEPFTGELAHKSAEDFFEAVIVRALCAKEIVVGYDFTFGLHRHGSVRTLAGLGAGHGIDVRILDAQFLNETLISSSNIRSLVTQGNVGEAARLLGRLYSIEGKVVAGRGTGKSLGARTANLETLNQLIPADGVYLTAAKLSPGDSGHYRGITSIGTNPTFPHAVFTIETHIIGEDIELMGRTLVIEFIKKMRDQITFASPEELKGQIRKDIAEAKTMHSSDGVKL